MNITIPESVAVCPECGGQLYAYYVWSHPKTGAATQKTVVNCFVEEKALDEWEENDDDWRSPYEVVYPHKYTKNHPCWQDTISKVKKFLIYKPRKSPYDPMNWIKYLKR